MNFVRFYKIWLVMCNVSPNSLGKYICEVMFSITGNITEIPCFVLTCIKFYDTEQYIDKIFQNDKYLEFIVWKEKV